MTILVAAVAGVALGFIGGPVVILVPWAAVAAICGARSRRAATVVGSGLAFGFAVSFVFLVRGYQGSEGIVAVVALFAGLSVFGAFCGAVISTVGWLTSSRLQKSWERPAR
jgi:hypothetical protein